MKKILALCAIILLLPTLPYLFAGHRRYFTSADDINSGTLPPERLSGVTVDSMTITNFTARQATFPAVTAVEKIGLGTVQYTPMATDGTVNQVIATNGAGQLSWVSGGQDVFALLNATYTKTFGHGGFVLYSTNTVCPFPGSCFWTGNSTINVIDIQAAITFGSTVAMTSFQIVESTGGVPKVPAQLLPVISRFPRMDVSTATADKLTSYSPVITTGVVIPAFTWVGVQTTTAPTSGTLPQGFTIMMNVWKKPYGGL